MSIPKEPRQIMINLMYLVLTALLALNVSNEILNAFKTLSRSIDRSNEAIDVRANEVYNQIVENEKQPGQEARVKPYRERADLVKAKADEMVKYLDLWKKRITMDAGGYDKTDTTIPEKMDNIDATTKLLCENKGGDTLAAKITEMRNFFLNAVNADDSGAIAKFMPLRVEAIKKDEYNKTGSWSLAYFEHMPAIAALALFSKFQNDVRSSENLVINKLFEEAHVGEIKFDTTAAIAVPKTTYALQGDKIEASILIAAFNKSNKPSVSISQGGGEKKDAVNGVVPWETVAAGTGLQTVKGTITLKREGGDIIKNWEFSYMVGTTGASMQLDKMNVFYIGVPNPVTVSAAGYAVEDVYLTLPTGSGATVDGTNGHYSITVSQQTNDFVVTIMAKSKVQGGAPTKVGESHLRVKYIPDPIATVAGIQSGAIAASNVRVQIAPIAVLKDFVYDAKFKITEFQFTLQRRGMDLQGPYPVKNAEGARFSDSKDVSTWMSKLKPGDRIYIEGIKGVGPDKRSRSLSPIILSLN